MLGGKKSGGMNVYVRFLSETLGEMGIKVDIYTRLDARCQPQVHQSLGDNVRVVHLEAGPYSPIHTDALADHVTEFTTSLVEFVSNDEEVSSFSDYDVIHSHYWLSGLVAGELNTLLPEPIPVLQMFHTLGHLKNIYAIDGQDIVSPVRLTAEEQIVSEVANKIIAASQNEADELVTHYGANPEAIVQVPPGVDLERFSPRSADTAKEAINVDCGEQLIVFAGRIEKLKGIDTLLRAMDILEESQSDDDPKRCVVIVGGDPWADDPEPEMYRLQKLTQELEIGSHVAFVGAKDQYSLPNYFAAADVVVMPSHYESFGMVALEAMAMGKPVIASEVGGLSDLVVDGVNGLHVPSRDAASLASAIGKVLGNPEFAKKLATQAGEDAAKFNWQIIATRIVDVYESLVDEQLVAKR